MQAQDQQYLLDGASLDGMGIFPSTRYQGSKSKIVDWISFCTKDLKFDSVLDAFGGTGCVGYMYKQKGKRVFYNDLLRFNYYISLAIIENTNIQLTDDDVKFILNRHKNIAYPTFISECFDGIYFTREENLWLDMVITNIDRIENKYKKALALYALFQSCIIKRPFNLFHRKNLYIRTAQVQRSFGNKKTWDTSFVSHFIKFAREANQAVFCNDKNNQSFNEDVFNLDVTADLVYIDTPYISSKGNGLNYHDYYHFLEGMVSYAKWPKLIDVKSKHKKIKSQENDWCNTLEIHRFFDKLFDKFKNSILVVSYRDDGIPSTAELIDLLKKYKANVEVLKLQYKYVLSKNLSKEVLIIAK